MKTLLAATVCVAAILHCACAAAQGWPAKPVRIVVPFPPGGSTDFKPE